MWGDTKNRALTARGAPGAAGTGRGLGRDRGWEGDRDRARARDWEGTGCSHGPTSIPWSHIPAPARAGIPRAAQGLPWGSTGVLTPGLMSCVTPWGIPALSWDGLIPQQSRWGCTWSRVGTDGCPEQPPGTARACGEQHQELGVPQICLQNVPSCSPAAPCAVPRDTEGLWRLLSLSPALLLQPAQGPGHHSLPCSPAQECQWL